MRWDGNRYHERWTFRRVTWPGMEEAEDYWQVTGGSLSESAFKDLRVTGTLTYSGGSVPDDNDAVRVYYGFTDCEGTRWEGPIATGFIDLGETEHDGALATGSATLSGLLAAASDTGPGRPLTVSAGTRAVEVAAGYMRALGLTVTAAPSAYELKTPHTFDSSDSWLAIANWLLSAAGFWGAYTDAWGTVQMQPYVEPTEREPTWTFRSDATSFMLHGVKESDNRAETPNAVRLWYEDDTVGLWAEAVNDDPRSPTSRVSRRRERQMCETVTELAGDTPQKMLANLKDMAAKRLRDNSTRIEYRDVPCLFVPVAVNDCAELDYTLSSMPASVGCVTAKDVDLSHGARTTVRLRSMVSPDFKVATSGKVAWSV